MTRPDIATEEFTVPIHDWTREGDWLFHDFHLSWVCELSRRLNGGILPSAYFAMSETIDHRPRHGLAERPEPAKRRTDPGRPGGLRFAEEQPPSARFVVPCAEVSYATRAVTIRSADTHAVVAVIRIVTQQDKRTPGRLKTFVDHALGALSHGIHLLIVDLFPPSRRDPQGIHKAIWDEIDEQPFELPVDKLLTVAAYGTGRTKTAYVEPVAVGDELPALPLFLTEYEYVPVPLEETYRATWDHVPQQLRPLLEPPAGG